MCINVIGYLKRSTADVGNQINERMRPSMSAYKRDVCNNYTVLPFPLTHACVGATSTFTQCACLLVLDVYVC